MPGWQSAGIRYAFAVVCVALGCVLPASLPGLLTHAPYLARLPLQVPARAARGDSPVPGLQPSSNGQSETGSRRSGKPLRILLVEDHGDTARIMKRLLQHDGHQVQNAGDLASARQLAQTGEFDLLLSDLGLPDGSGMDLLRQLRSRGFSAAAIAVSGSGQEQDMQRRSREAGFAAHLTKPASPDQLRATIARVAIQGTL